LDLITERRSFPLTILCQPSALGRPEFVAGKRVEPQSCDMIYTPRVANEKSKMFKSASGFHAHTSCCTAGASLGFFARGIV
jgi:hypothetical protein